MNIGILGASRIAPDSIISPAKKLLGINIVDIAASNSQRAEKFALDYGIPSFKTSYDELIGSQNIDVVYISLKNDMHFEYALKAIDNKKHVLIEKPICLSYEEFKVIAKLAEKQKVVAVEAMMVEHHPWQNAILNIIDEREYGSILKIDTVNEFVLEGQNDYRFTSERGAGAIYDLGCYCLQFIQKMVGLEHSDINCNYKSNNGGRVDTEFNAEMIINNVQVNISCSFNKPFKAYHRVECEKGIVEVKNFFRAGFGYNKMNIHCTDKVSEKTDKVSFDPMNFYHNQLKDLQENIYNRKPNKSLEESGERVRIMEILHDIKQLVN